MNEFSNIFDIVDSNLDNETKDLLHLLEEVNPSDQKYYSLDEYIAITYKHRLDVFNFNERISLKIPVTIIGFPISIDRQGYKGDHNFLFDVLRKIKGVTVVLNMEEPLIQGGRTLSTFVFKNKYATFDSYLNSLRSGYRRRAKEALKLREKIQVSKIDKADFNLLHYNLYRDVFYRSENKLELLPLDFFKKFNGELFQFSTHKEEVLSFILLKEQNSKIDFMFCGFKKEDIKTYDIYFNMLLWIVKEGIKRGVEEISFGQTSEETKLKIGCKEVEKYLIIHHNNKLIGSILKKLTPYFSYKGYPLKHRVFKESI